MNGDFEPGHPESELEARAAALVPFLCSIPLFQHLSEDEYGIAMEAEEVEYPSNTVIVREGTLCDEGFNGGSQYFYVIQRALWS